MRNSVVCRSCGRLRSPYDVIQKIENTLNNTPRHNSPHVKESKTVWDSGFHAVDFRFQELNSRLCFVSGTWFWISIVSGIPDSLSRILVSTSKSFSDSGFHRQIFHGSRILLHGATVANTKKHPEFPYLTIFLT